MDEAFLDLVVYPVLITIATDLVFYRLPNIGTALGAILSLLLWVVLAFQGMGVGYEMYAYMMIVGFGPVVLFSSFAVSFVFRVLRRLLARWRSSNA